MEPERPIEKTLRAYANKRRDEAGAPLELHPVTRKALHDEIARKFPSSEPKPRSFLNLLAQIWPRMAFAVGLLAVLGVVVFVVLPEKDHSPSPLASNDRQTSAFRDEPAKQLAAPAPDAAPTELETLKAATATETAAIPADKVERSLAESRTLVDAPGAAGALNEPAPQPITSPAVELDDSRRGAGTSTTVASAPVFPAPVKSESARSRGFARPSAQPATLGTPPPQTTGVAPTTVSGDKAVAVDEALSPGAKEFSLADRAQLALKSAPATPAIGGTQFKNEDTKLRVNVGTTQRFSQVATPSKAKAAADQSAAPVLANFQVEQTGSQLKITDNDGSTYTGQLQQVEVALRKALAESYADTFARLEKKQTNSTNRAALATTPNKTHQTYSFTVSGTNQTLNEQIVFNGELAFTNVLGVPVTNVGQLGTLPATLRLDNSRIKGRAKVGNRSEIDVEALPAPR